MNSTAAPALVNFPKLIKCRAARGPDPLRSRPGCCSARSRAEPSCGAHTVLIRTRAQGCRRRGRRRLRPGRARSPIHWNREQTERTEGSAAALAAVRRALAPNLRVARMLF